MKVKYKIKDALLLIFTLRLKISEIGLLRFDNVRNQKDPKIKVSNLKKGSSKFIGISDKLENEIRN